MAHLSHHPQYTNANQYQVQELEEHFIALINGMDCCGIVMGSLDMFR